jgi:hypothetical protein
MSSFAAYGRLEKGIAAADVGSIRQRWEYGRRLLVDRAMTTEGGNFKNGVLDRLIIAAKRQGVKNINRRELQYRRTAADAYPTEAHITQIHAQYESWWEVIRAGFPAVQLPLDADTEPFDPRTAEEKARDLGVTPEGLAEEEAGQLALFSYFPAELFDELSTLGELEKHAEEMTEWTARRARKDRERAEYVRRLLAAVNGNRNATWGEAQAALEASA